jgi:LysR family glycine cleavage system transcriptional activator
MNPLPLNALRVFEAAARHLSFAKAAEELNVTPAAVSHQIKALEARIGQPLFRRFNRRLMLTDAAQLCLPGVRDGLDRLAAALALASRSTRNTLTVSSAPTFAARWLVPRLERFRARHPEIEIRIDATEHIVDFAAEPIDVAIRYGAGPYPGLRVDRLFGAPEFPVCSPRLLEGPHPLKRPEDLRFHTLLHSDVAPDNDLYPNWRMWLLAAGVKSVDPTRGPRFSPETMAIDAAIKGQGVALSSAVLVGDELAQGRLVKPFDVVLKLEFAYFVVAPKSTADRPAVKAFREWLLEEARPMREAEQRQS